MLEIKGFLETSLLDWPGKICSVLFLPYCNFRCPYCHNHPLIFYPERFPSIPISKVIKRLNNFKQWVDGVCITGGEPTIHKDLPNLINEIKKNGFMVKLDTNGSNPEMLEQLIREGIVDFISMDVKAPLNPNIYSQSIGVKFDINPIIRSIEILKQGKVDFQFRMTVVPTLHEEKDIKILGSQLRVGKKFILQNFNPSNPLDPTFKSIIPLEENLLKEIERTIQEMV